MNNIPYFDVHTHQNKQYDGVYRIFNVFAQDIDIFAFDCNKLYSIGLHPWDIEKCNAKLAIQQLEESIKHKNIVAVGEAGLDKSINTTFELQTKILIMQLEIAERAKMPVIIHCVKAYSELLSLRNLYNKTPWIIHWFNSNITIAHKLIEMGCFLSFGVSLFNSKSKAYRVFKSLKPCELLLETDEADLTIDQLYMQAANLQRIEPEYLKQQIELNFKHCFGNIL